MNRKRLLSAVARPRQRQGSAPTLTHIRSQPGMGVQDAPARANDPEGLSTDQCIRSSTAHPRVFSEPHGFMITPSCSMTRRIPPRNGKESGIRSAAPCPFRVECAHAAALLRKGTYIHTVQGRRAAAWCHEGGGKRGNARYSISHDACTPPRAWRPRRRDADSSRAPLQLMHLLLCTTRAALLLPCGKQNRKKSRKNMEGPRASDARVGLHPTTSAYPPLPQRGLIFLASRQLLFPAQTHARTPIFREVSETRPTHSRPRRCTGSALPGYCRASLTMARAAPAPAHIHSLSRA